MDTVSNRQLTLLRKLQKKKYRQREQLFLVEGERAVQQVIENRAVRLKYIFFDQGRQLWEQPEWNAHASDFPSFGVLTGDFLEITDTDNPQGVLALCHMPDEMELTMLAGSEGIIVATDAIQDPGNLGTIVRSAAWFGAKGLFLGVGTVDLFNPKVVRSTAGSTGAIPFVNVDLNNALTQYREAGWEVLMLDASKGAENLKEMNPPAKTILVIGNEANGIDHSLLREPGRRKVQITSPSGESDAESLNASIALSIGLYALSG